MYLWPNARPSYGTMCAICMSKYIDSSLRKVTFLHNWSNFHNSDISFGATLHVVGESTSIVNGLTHDNATSRARSAGQI